MKYTQTSVAVFVFSTVFANAANAAPYPVTSDQDNVTIIGTQGAGYDLDLLAKDAVIGLQTANSAYTNADAAQTTANQAQADATLAGLKADTANSLATQAGKDALDASALANTANNKADQALQQNVVNGSNINTLQNDVGNLKGEVSNVDQEAKLAGALADTADQKADTAIQGVLKNGSDIIAVGTKADKAETDAVVAGAKADTALTTANTAQGTAEHAEITATDARNKADNAQTSANTAVTSASEANTKADANTATLATKVDTTTFKTDLDRQDKALQTASDKATQAYNTGIYAQSLAADAQTVAAANKTAVANVQARTKANETAIQNHAIQLANHEQRITALENENNAKFSSLEKQQNEDRKEYRAGIAGVGAIAGLHYVDTDNAVAVGAANFKDAQGYAIGYRHKFTEKVAATLSTSGTSNGDELVAASASFGW